jgi:hypothetical protein
VSQNTIRTTTVISPSRKRSGDAGNPWRALDCQRLLAGNSVERTFTVTLTHCGSSRRGRRRLCPPDEALHRTTDTAGRGGDPPHDFFRM